MIIYNQWHPVWFMFGTKNGPLSKGELLFYAPYGIILDWSLIEANGQFLYNSGLVKCY